jgi:hypothetical protein
MTITDTLVVVGPGGIGKSPLDRAVKAEVCRIDPYRLRRAGPRDSQDVLYAHPRLRDELYLTYQRLGVGLTYLSDRVHWFPAAGTLFLKVRDEWHVMFLEALPAGIAKAEIFAPAIRAMFENPQVRCRFGRVSMVVLDPAGPLETLTDLGPVKEKTRFNCQRRGDAPDSVEKRVASIDEEAEAWREMIALGATEFANWEFAEYVYREKGERETLAAARRVLLDRCPRLEVFFKTEDDIRSRI